MAARGAGASARGASGCRLARPHARRPVGGEARRALCAAAAVDAMELLLIQRWPFNLRRMARELVRVLATLPWGTWSSRAMSATGWTPSLGGDTRRDGRFDPRWLDRRGTADHHPQRRALWGMCGAAARRRGGLRRVRPPLPTRDELVGGGRDARRRRARAGASLRPRAPPDLPARSRPTADGGRGDGAGPGRPRWPMVWNVARRTTRRSGRSSAGGSRLTSSWAPAGWAWCAGRRSCRWGARWRSR